MGIRQATKLIGDSLNAAGRARKTGLFCHVVRQCACNASKRLHTLGEKIHQLLLFAVVLVEQKMQPVERRARGLPMRLLVQIPQGHRVGQQPIEGGDALEAYVVR